MIGSDSSEISARCIGQSDPLLFISQEAASAYTQSYRLCEFVGRLLTGKAIEEKDGRVIYVGNISSDVTAPDHLSASAAPISPGVQHIAFDVAALLTLRDTLKRTVLAPVCLESAFAQLLSAGDEGMTKLGYIQDSVRTCIRIAAFEPRHVRLLAGLGARHIDLVRLPAFPLTRQVVPQVDLLLIAHEVSDTRLLALEQALGERLPSLTIEHHRGQFLPSLNARIHLHVGQPCAFAPDLRVMDSHAMQRPVVLLSPQAAGAPLGPAMQVIQMRTGLMAVDVEDAVTAIETLLLNPVLAEVFHKGAALALQEFNEKAEAELLEALT